MSSMLRTLRGGPCRPLTYDRPVAFTLNQDSTTWTGHQVQLHQGLPPT
jgi:hypothetical protein